MCRALSRSSYRVGIPYVVLSLVLQKREEPLQCGICWVAIKAILPNSSGEYIAELRKTWILRNRVYLTKQKDDSLEIVLDRMIAFPSYLISDG